MTYRGSFPVHIDIGDLVSTVSRSRLSLNLSLLQRCQHGGNRSLMLSININSIEVDNLVKNLYM